MEEHANRHSEPASDDAYAPRPVAAWFILAAVAALLFMSFGCVMYLMQVLADPNAMPLDKRAAYDAQPSWLTAAYAIAVWVGLAGTVALLLKRRWAEVLLGISLAATLVWLAGLILVTRMRETMSASDLLVALVVTALTWTIFWFARHSRQRGWIR